MISFSIEPIEAEALFDIGDWSATSIEGYHGFLTIILNDNINETKIDLIVGGRNCSFKQCLERARAMLYGISFSCSVDEELAHRKKMYKKED